MDAAAAAQKRRNNLQHKNIKKYIIFSLRTALLALLLVALPAMSLSACVREPAEAQDDRPVIVCTSFAAYDWVQNILGARAGDWQLIRINDKGADMHSYQPSARDIAAITGCDLLVYTGGLSEEWLLELTCSESGFTGRVYSLMAAETAPGHDHDHHEGEVCQLDEHIWLSPQNALGYCRELADVIAALDPEHSREYLGNAASYLEKLKALDEEYRQVIASCPGDSLIFADRFPFIYLVEDYGLSYYAAFPGCSAETEASFATIIELADKLNELESDALIITEHSSDDIARAIINAAGRDDVAVYEMNSLQSVSQKDVAGGLTYLGAMEENLRVITKALN